MSFNTDTTNIFVNENPNDTTTSDCCPICGSLGVAHFEDKDDDEKFHRCLRCLSEFHGCHFSPSERTVERLNTASKVVSG